MSPHDASDIAPSTFASSARLCLEQLASACDAVAASSAEPRLRDVATHLEHAGLKPRELEQR